MEAAALGCSESKEYRTEVIQEGYTSSPSTKNESCANAYRAEEMQKEQPDILSGLDAMMSYIKAEAPLIHCITNPISINDCANILLALGARPIMAEHPLEVAEITAIAKGLALNLGNITDARMESMVIAARTAKKQGIPVVLDLVGVSCSTLRRNYTKKLLAATIPDIVKGNITELRSIFHLPVTPGMGVEAGAKELVTLENAPEYAAIFQAKAREYGTTLLATGPIDMVANAEAAYILTNGTSALAAITGTGCMTNVLAGACLAAAKESRTSYLTAAIMACLILGIAAENIHHLYEEHGPGTFHAKLMDSVHRLTPQELQQKAKIQKIS